MIGFKNKKHIRELFSKFGSSRGEEQRGKQALPLPSRQEEMGTRSPAPCRVPSRIHPGVLHGPRCRRRGARRGGLRLLCQFFFVIFCFLFVFLFLSLLFLFFLFFIFLFLAAPGHLLLLLQNKGRKRKQTSAAGQIKLSTWANLNKHGQTMPGGQRPRGKKVLHHHGVPVCGTGCSQGPRASRGDQGGLGSTTVAALWIPLRAAGQPCCAPC